MRSTSDCESASVGLQETMSWVRYCPEATRSAPITKACSPADGVERISRPTPPTEPEAAMIEIARPSI